MPKIPIENMTVHSCSIVGVCNVQMIVGKKLFLSLEVMVPGDDRSGIRA